MPPKKKGQKKRKSAGVGDIFEVSDKDLSPEPDENTTEPAAKVLKTRNSDVSEARKSSELHNFSDEAEENKNNEETGVKKRVSGKNSALKNPVGSSKSEDKETTEAMKAEVSSIENQELVVISDNDQDLKESGKKIKEDINIGNNSSSSETNNKEQCEEKLKEEFTDKSNKTDVLECSQGEILTIVDDDNSQDDVIMVCDNSITDNSGNVQTSDAFVILDDTLEDGEVIESVVEGPQEKPKDETDCDISVSPCITIKFSDTSIADLYKVAFIKFIQSFVELTPKDVGGDTINIFRDSNLDPKEWVVVDDTVCLSKQVDGKQDEEELAQEIPKTPAKKKKKKKNKPQKEPELFVVDTNPGVATQKPIVAKYSTKFLLNDEKKNEEKPDTSKPSSAQICFNCGKDHSLKDCPIPKNYAKINANRQKFQNNKNKTTRYHLEEEQKYAHLSPGKISPGLRKALGLKNHQIPSYVYQMRLLGYPPGWLEEAKNTSPVLEMFDIHGKNVKNTTAKKSLALDPEKVVDYPGYNVPLEKEFKDEYKYHRVPPYHDRFSKENLIKHFQELHQRQQDDLEMRDMDLDTTNEAIEIEDAIETEAKDADYSMDSTTNSEISIQELQKQKDSLLEEIKKSGDTLPWDDSSCTQSSVVSDESKPKKDNEPKENKKDDEDTSTHEETELQTTVETRVEIKISEASETNNTSINSKVNSVKETTFGTPILKSASPYTRLPNPDNFMVGVSPVIDFENLPNSTGKYEQMTGVIQKVRDTLKNLQKRKT